MRKILTGDLGMCKASANMVPQIFSSDEKQRQFNVCAQSSCQLAEGNNFFSSVVTHMNHGTSIIKHQ